MATERSGRATARKAVVWVAGVVVTAWVGLLVTDWWQSREPYDIETETNPDKIATKQGYLGDSSYYLIPGKTIGQIPEPPLDRDVCSGRYLWASKLGGLDANRTPFRFSVESRSDSEVRILDLKVRRVERADPPVDGVELGCPGQGARPEIRSVTVDLDEPSPRARIEDANGVEIEPVFTLTNGQSETFEVTGLATTCDCTWELVVAVRHEGALKEEVVGRFRTVSASKLPTYHWVDGDWVNIDAGSSQAPYLSAPARVDACALLDAGVAASILGEPVGQVNGGGATPGPGASRRPMSISTCSAASEQVADLSTGMHHTFAVLLHTAGSLDDAVAEYHALVEAFAREARQQRELTGFGEAATSFEGVVVARAGNEVLVAQVNSPNPEVASRVEAFAKDVVTRAWPSGGPG